MNPVSDQLPLSGLQDAMRIKGQKSKPRRRKVRNTAEHARLGDDVVFTIGANKNGEKRPVLELSFYSPLVNAARLNSSLSIDVRFDSAAREGFVQVNPDGPFALTWRGGSRILHTRLVWYEDMPYFTERVPVTHFEVWDDGSIVFKVPESAVWDRKCDSRYAREQVTISGGE